jgi:hypothetical protein
MYEKRSMETSDIVQIVSVCLTVLGFVASEIMALCPGFKANGLVHWLSMWAEKNTDIVVTLPNGPNSSTYELRRRPSIHGERPSIAVNHNSWNSPPPTPAPSGDMENDSEATLSNDVSRPNSQIGE